MSKVNEPSLLLTIYPRSRTARVSLYDFLSRYSVFAAPFFHLQPLFYHLSFICSKAYVYSYHQCLCTALTPHSFENAKAFCNPSHVCSLFNNARKILRDECTSRRRTAENIHELHTRTRKSTLFINHRRSYISVRPQTLFLH